MIVKKNAYKTLNILRRNKMSRIVHGNHPFNWPKDQPKRIGREDVGFFTYPDYALGTSDMNTLYISTDKLTLGYYELAPGAQFAPPDHHPGDECYFILEGELTEVNAISGQACRVKEGEVLLIPYEGAHGGYNFGSKRMKAVFALAPNMVSGQNFPTDLDGKWRILKGKDEDSFTKYPDKEVKEVLSSIEYLGRWPVSGEELRKEPKYLRVIDDNHKLNIINGMDNPYLMRFAVSNDLINFGELILPSGGKGCRISDKESHKGETAIFVDKGTLSFVMEESRETFVINKDEVMFIPAGMEYTMINNWEEFAHAIFVIAPEL